MLQTIILPLRSSSNSAFTLKILFARVGGGRPTDALDRYFSSFVAVSLFYFDFDVYGLMSGMLVCLGDPMSAEGVSPLMCFRQIASGKVPVQYSTTAPSTSQADINC